MRIQKFILTLVLLTFVGFVYAQNSYIQIICEPGVNVFLNGTEKGETSKDLGGIILESLKAGKYTIKLEKQGFVPQQGEVSIADGEVFTYYASPFVPSVSVTQIGTGSSVVGETRKTVKTGNLLIQTVPVAIHISIPQLGVVNNPKTDDKWKADNVVVGKIGIEYVWNTKLLKDSIEIKANQTTHMFVNMISNEITNRSSWGGGKKYTVVAAVTSNPVEARHKRVVQEETTSNIQNNSTPVAATASAATASSAVIIESPSATEAAQAKPANYNFKGTGHSVAEVEMVFVDGGSFKMGAENLDPSESPKHVVRLSSFYLSKYEITNQQFCEFLNDVKCLESGIFEGQLFIQTRLKTVDLDFINGRFSPKVGKEYYPVVGVTWYGADAYCRWAGGRLPTEAEWEYAAKGGIKSENYTYAGGRNINKVGWWKNNADNKTHMVGQKEPNELGLYDMTGNVIEWVNDWFNQSYYQVTDATNPQGPPTGVEKITRGGCYMFSDRGSRITRRVPASPVAYGPNAGFRLYRANQ